MPPKNPDAQTELLNFILAGQLEYRAPQQRQFPRELARRYPKLGAKEIARRTDECQAAVDRAVELARDFVAASGGYQYLNPWREKVYADWAPAMQREFDWIGSELLARLFTSALSAIYQEERVKYG